MISDAGLVQRVLLLNDKNSYCDLVRKYQIEVRTYLFRLVRNQELASDLAQEVFLQGYRKLNQLKEPDKFRSWVYTIAHYQFLQWYRSHENFLEESKIPDHGVESSVFAGLEVASLFKHLKAEEQSVLTLCLAQEFSHTEAAEALGMPLGTVKTLIHRAREKLGGLLEQQ